jgi:hypothetical protein
MSFEETKNIFVEKILCVIHKSHLPENQRFSSKVYIFNEIFTLILENFDIISRPGFEFKGVIIDVIREKIQLWKEVVPIVMQIMTPKRVLAIRDKVLQTDVVVVILEKKLNAL